MSKQPYIPLYTGDWEQDVNALSLEAEGAWLKLTIKLWHAPQRGLLKICYKQMEILFKKSPEKTAEIWQELMDSGVCDYEILDNNWFNIKSRRMTRNLELSKVRAESGAKGGEAKASKLKAKPKQNSSKTLANNDIDTDNNSINSGIVFKENTDTTVNTTKEKAKSSIGTIFPKELTYPFPSQKFKDAWALWIRYKKSQWKFQYKSIETEQIAMDGLKEKSDNDEENAITMIKRSIANGWKGFVELTTQFSTNGNGQHKSTTHNVPPPGFDYENDRP